MYTSTAEFARTYGKTNPNEDFSTAFEAYFQYKTGRLVYSEFVRLQDKMNFIGEFITSIS